MEDKNTDIDELMRQINMMDMEDDDDEWEMQTESATSFADEGILGRLVPKKPIRRQTLGALLEGYGF